MTKMENKFFYAKNISLENILKLLFNKPEIEHSTKLNLLLQFEIITHVNNHNFDEYFFFNVNDFEQCFRFYIDNEQLVIGFIYDHETQKFEVGISSEKDLLENEKEEIFSRLYKELQKSKFHYLYKIQDHYVSNCERIRILQYLKYVAEKEYNNGFMTFYPELIDIQNLIIETFESSFIQRNPSNVNFSMLN